MDLIEEISRYPGIMDKVKQLGKVKENFLNKKLMAEATELWQRMGWSLFGAYSTRYERGSSMVIRMI